MLTVGFGAADHQPGVGAVGLAGGEHMGRGLVWFGACIARGVEPFGGDTGLGGVDQRVRFFSESRQDGRRSGGGCG